MRRIFVLGMAAILTVATTTGAVAKTDLVRQPTPEAVVAEHLDALNDCDVDRLMAQYPDGIQILLPGGVTVAGRDEVRALFEGFCLPFPAGLAGLKFTEKQAYIVSVENGNAQPAPLTPRLPLETRWCRTGKRDIDLRDKRSASAWHRHEKSRRAQSA